MTRKQTLSTKQAADVAGVTPRTIYRWWRGGLLKPSFFTPSGRPRFRTEDVLLRRTTVTTVTS